MKILGRERKEQDQEGRRKKIKKSCGLLEIISIKLANLFRLEEKLITWKIEFHSFVLCY